MRQDKTLIQKKKTFINVPLTKANYYISTYCSLQQSKAHCQSDNEKRGESDAELLHHTYGNKSSYKNDQN